MMKWMSLAVAVLAFAPVFAAENLIRQTGAWKDAPIDEALSKAEGTRVFRISKNRAWVYSMEHIPVEPGKSYKISMDLRCADASRVSPGNYIGVCLLDAGNRFITRNHVFVVPDTATTVAADAPKGAREITVNGAIDPSAKLKIGVCLAFNAKQDLSDLPNRNLSGNITKVQTKDGKTVFTLARPLTAAVKAGTPVRCHMSAVGHNYCVPVRGLGAEWKTFTGKLSGADITGTAPYGSIWPGTKTFRLVLVVNYSPKVQSEVWVKNISVTAE